MTIDERVRAQFRLDTNCPVEMEREYRIMINERRDLKGARVIDGISSFFRAIIYRGDSYIMANCGRRARRCARCAPRGTAERVTTSASTA